MENSTMAALLMLFLFSIFHSQEGVLSSDTKPNQDASYMKFVHNADVFPEKEEYDYVVIGGGTAGCPLAATLSSKSTVLLLERGSHPNSFPSVLSVEGLSRVFTDEDDGENPYNRFISDDGVENVRGRVLGGSSMVNGGFFSRAHPEFFNQSKFVKWDMKMVEEAYQWVEETVVSEPILGPWQAAFRKGLVEAGIGPDNGFTVNYLIGTRNGGSIFDSHGRRHGAVELLNRANLRNLKVAIQATVKKIIFSTSPDLSATGVLYSDSKGKLHRAFIRNKGEIILSAGAIGSPQLLLLSGVGPKSHLSSLKLPVVLHQSNVGKFMSDNPRFGVHMLFPFPMPAESVQVVGTLKGNIHIESLVGSLPSSIPTLFTLIPLPQSSSVNFSLATVGGKFTQVSSVGSLRLSSSDDVKRNPTIRFNYFTHPGDLARCVRGVRKVGDFLNTRTMEEIKTMDFQGNKRFKFLGPPLPENMSDDASVGAYCRRTVTTFWHYHGGCVMGKVVDGNYRVAGIKNLRVVDGSTFTDSPGTNPMGTLMMIGRYVGLKMLQERDANEIAFSGINNKIATF